MRKKERTIALHYVWLLNIPDITSLLIFNATLRKQNQENHLQLSEIFLYIHLRRSVKVYYPQTMQLSREYVPVITPREAEVALKTL